MVSSARQTRRWKVVPCGRTANVNCRRRPSRYSCSSRATARSSDPAGGRVTRLPSSMAVTASPSVETARCTAALVTANGSLCMWWYPVERSRSWVKRYVRRAREYTRHATGGFTHGVRAPAGLASAGTPCPASVSFVDRVPVPDRSLPRRHGSLVRCSPSEGFDWSMAVRASG